MPGEKPRRGIEGKGEAGVAVPDAGDDARQLDRDPMVFQMRKPRRKGVQLGDEFLARNRMEQVGMDLG